MSVSGNYSYKPVPLEEVLIEQKEKDSLPPFLYRVSLKDK
jgi:hypothetical protein